MLGITLKICKLSIIALLCMCVFFVSFDADMFEKSQTEKSNNVFASLFITKAYAVWWLVSRETARKFVMQIIKEILVDMLVEGPLISKLVSGMTSGSISDLQNDLQLDFQHEIERMMDEPYWAGIAWVLGESLMDIYNEIKSMIEQGVDMDAWDIADMLFMVMREIERIVKEEYDNAIIIGTISRVGAGAEWLPFVDVTDRVKKFLRELKTQMKDKKKKEEARFKYYYTWDTSKDKHAVDYACDKAQKRAEDEYMKYAMAHGMSVDQETKDKKNQKDNKISQIRDKAKKLIDEDQKLRRELIDKFILEDQNNFYTTPGLANSGVSAHDVWNDGIGAVDEMIKKWEDFLNEIKYAEVNGDYVFKGYDLKLLVRLCKNKIAVLKRIRRRLRYIEKQLIEEEDARKKKYGTVPTGKLPYRIAWVVNKNDFTEMVADNLGLVMVSGTELNLDTDDVADIQDNIQYMGLSPAAIQGIDQVNLLAWANANAGSSVSLGGSVNLVPLFANYSVGDTMTILGTNPFAGLVYRFDAIDHSTANSHLSTGIFLVSGDSVRFSADGPTQTGLVQNLTSGVNFTGNLDAVTYDATATPNGSCTLNP